MTYVHRFEFHLGQLTISLEKEEEVSWGVLLCCFALPLICQKCDYGGSVCVSVPGCGRLGMQ